MSIATLAGEDTATGDRAAAEPIPDWHRGSYAKPHPDAGHLVLVVSRIVSCYIPPPEEWDDGTLVFRTPGIIAQRLALEQYARDQTGNDPYLMRRILMPLLVKEHVLLSLRLLRARGKAHKRGVRLVGAEFLIEERALVELMLYCRESALRRLLCGVKRQKS